jgi:hypothetical protein
MAETTHPTKWRRVPEDVHIHPYVKSKLEGNERKQKVMKAIKLLDKEIDKHTKGEDMCLKVYFRQHK